MTGSTLTFDAVSESTPGPKWAARWQRSWPAYEAWFVARGGDSGPSRGACEAALQRHMPELVPLHAQLTRLSGGGDRAARFLSTLCPPTYLGGCSIAAASRGDAVRLVRNYDLSPDLNEGLLLRSEWTGRAVMGMVEFLWGLSDGINDAGLAVALAFGGPVFRAGDVVETSAARHPGKRGCTRTDLDTADPRVVPSRQGGGFRQVVTAGPPWSAERGRAFDAVSRLRGCVLHDRAGASDARPHRCPRSPGHE